MLDAQQEIIDTVMGLISRDPLLNQVSKDDISEIIDHLMEFQFKPNEPVTRKFIEGKIDDISKSIMLDTK